MVKYYSFEKLVALCDFLSENEDFINVTMENYHLLCEVMDVSKPEKMHEKRGRPLDYVKLYNIFRRAKRYLSRRLLKVTGSNLAEAIYRTQTNPYDIAPVK